MVWVILFLVYYIHRGVQVIALYIGIGAVVLVGIILANVFAYNALVKARNKTKEAFSSIDVHLKMRYDLIPNLVEVVRGHMKHEEKIMSMVANVRSTASKAKNEQEKIAAANEAGKVINQLFATSEDYPDLKSDKLFRRLSREMVDIEDKISAARRFYNSAVNKYNNLVMQFPTSMFAAVFRFKKKETFEINEIERQNISI